LLTKLRTSKLSLSTSSTSVCVRPCLTFSPKAKSWLRGAGGNEDLQKYVEIGAYYYFNKNFNIYVDYQLNLIDKSDYSWVS
jgi:predicted porin